jgi:uncharacterized protein
MLNNNLPIYVDLVRFTENPTDLHGSLPISAMTRLAPSLLNSEGQAEVHMQLGVDRDKIRFAKGTIRAVLSVQCQRCLEPFSYELNSHFASAVVNNDAKAKALPDHYEPVLVTADNLNLAEMIEEELLVNLPIVLMHDPKDCNVKMPVVVADEDATVTEKVNPFKIIESLKVKPK